jgi:hypothetical protein
MRADPFHSEEGDGELSRLRASISGDPEDRVLQELVRRARGELTDALNLARRSRSPKAREIARKLEQVLGGLESVGNLTQLEDPNNPTEEERIRRFREELKKRHEAERAAKIASKKA